ncbi:SPOR domain-containing protein [Paenibacillus thalictri]|uniref:SPOR domain-containing protein n=1 Tax=Paenibacillus thalictri TaxID=2527873 RepID=A0A4Q9E092_9BACL|nr:SPOR domain-containing protein [Paenibacillus thalictri]TBL81638.1 SPOR domain-containing protein [Paenibacillus thalictri]
MKKGRITYRFQNGQRVEAPQEVDRNVIPLYQEEFEVRDAVKEGTGGESLFSGTLTPQSEWKSPYEEETERIERMIRNSQPMQTHHPETGYFETTGKYDEPLRDHRWYVPEEPVRVKKPPFGSWFKITVSVAGAVVTGIAFGFFVLSMFSGHDDAASKAKQAAGTAPAGQVAAPSTAGKQTAGAGTDKAASAASTGVTGTGAASAAGSASAAMATASVNISGKTYSFLQAGVFSTQQSADTAQADLKKNGFAGATESGDKFTVYAAMAPTRDDALAISQQLKQKNTDVFIKTVELPALTKVKWNGKQTDALQACLEQGQKLVQLISGLTVPHLGESKPTALDETKLQAIKSAHQSWIGMHTAMSDSLSDEAKATHQKMIKALDTAIVSLDEYKKKPATSYLWQAQSTLMQYTISDKELRNSLSAQ